MEPITFRKVVLWPKKIGAKVSHIGLGTVILQTPRSDREKLSKMITRELDVLAKNIGIVDIIAVLGALVFEANVIASVGEVIGEIAEEESHS